MTVGFYSPLPPAHSGVADYAAALLPALRELGHVEISPRDEDVALYHLGNNGLHRDIYSRALERPGVVVLHDAVLQHFFLGSMGEEQYVAESVYNYGEWFREEAHAMYRDRASSAQDTRYFSRPLLKRIARASKAVIVHNAAAAKLVLTHAPGARVVEIPHFFVPPPVPDAADLLRFRARLGIPPGDYLFGVFGYLRESKRLIPTLKAFLKLRAARPQSALLVAGEFVSQDLARAVAPLLQQSGVYRIGHMTDSDFQLATSAVDCCINLRHPAAGETSGIAIRLMGLGKPVLLTDGAETSSIPETACFRIDPGLAEAADLFQHMFVACEFPQVGRAIGRQAAEHIARYHLLKAVASQYWKTLCAVCSSQGSCLHC